MSSELADRGAAWRRSIYWLLIVVGAASVAGRILAVDTVDLRRVEGYLYEQGRTDWQRRVPFLSANDRSRWCTIRALVEHGTYAIDDIIQDPRWDTIDAVKHDDAGRAAPAADAGHVYSSKPPLLATILAGEYWLIYQLTPYSLQHDTYLVARFMLLTINLPLLVGMWLVLARHIERYGHTAWGRSFVLAAAVFGTMLTTFAVVLTNHLVAAAFAMFAFDGLVRIIAEGDVRARRFVQVGFCAAFCAANELPALAFFALAGLLLLWKFPRPTLLYFVPAALVVAAASFGTNYAAHGTLVPPYGQRVKDNNWYEFQYLRNGKVRQSYWSQQSEKSQVDVGEPDAKKYALHALVGHHGIFSLTPIWLLTLGGLYRTLRTPDHPLRSLAALVLVTSVVCIAFYLARPQIDRNYGGVSSGFRWVFWFAPLWLATMMPSADAVGESRVRRSLCLLLLAISVVSASYPTWNPWARPWAEDAYEAFIK